MIQRHPKKSETIEVRVAHGLKQALMSKAAKEGRSASEVVRLSINQYLLDRKTVDRVPLRWQPAVAMTGAALLLAVAANVPSSASAAPDLRKLFLHLDTDSNGVVDEKESAVETTRVIMSDRVDADGIALHISTLPDALSVPGLKTSFADADRNENGFLSYEEFAVYNQQLRRRRFAMGDVDDDGRITLGEYRRMPGVPADNLGRELFVSHDVDSDGFISRDEYLAQRRS